MKFINILLLSVLSLGIIAETSEQYTYRAEFFFGDIKEGKSYEDVKAQNMEYQNFLEEHDLKYGRSLFVPIWSGERKYDIIEYGYWPDGQEQYREWGAYMNEYPAWAAENSEFNEEIVDTKRSVSMRGVRARGIRIPQEERDRFKFVDFARCSFKAEGNIDKLLDLNARIEAKEIEMGNRAGYGMHYLIPYRGVGADAGYDYIRMIHYYSAEKRSELISTWDDFMDMMENEGLLAEYNSYATCDPQSTYRVEWLYNTFNN